MSDTPEHRTVSADLDDPVVVGLGNAIDPPGRVSQFAARAVERVCTAFDRLRRWDATAWVTLLIVAGCSLFTLAQLGPSNLFSSSTPAGGDMGAHVWAPAYLRDHLIPSLRLTGWTPDWYAGFPAFQYYMVLPSLAIAVLSWFLPYGMAFKLVAVSGLLSLPIACWAFGRLVRLPFPVPPLMAVAGTAFLFDRSFSIYGGNIASTLAGEFAFSISLTFAVLFLGVFGRGLENGRHRGLAAALLALTGLCHLIPFLFACAGAAVWFLISLARRTGFTKRLWWSFCALGIGGALMAWWILPFYYQSGYMNDMGWEKKTDYFSQLFERTKLDPGLVNSPPIQWLLVMALLGVVMSIAWKRRGGAFLVGIAAVSAIAFVYMPQGRFWNARVLPFWFLALYLLAAVGVGELGRTVASLLSRDPETPRRSVTVATALVGTFFALVAIALPLRALPDTLGVGPVKVSIGGVKTDGRYHWLMFSTKDSSFIPSWAKWNFSGYEGKPAYPEYHDIVQTMDELGQSKGCGRAMWEHEPQHDRYGTPMALMLLPFWTDGCIGSMEGLYFEASSTTPYHFLNQDELSFAPSNAQRDLMYFPGSPDQTQFDLGVSHLQMLGVKYYMAITDQMKAFAAKNKSLTEVAKSGPWKVYEVANSALVAGLDNDPVVLTGVKPHDWLKAVEGWYMDPAQWPVYPAAGGPAEWQRIPGDELGTPAVETTPTTPIAVTDIRTGTDTISFDVSKVGTPVLVKASYFPNWKVDGAKGPWRVGPNLMVVVPTSTTVQLHYGHTPIEWISLLITLAGVACLVLVARAGAVEMPEPRRWLPERVAGADDDGSSGEEVDADVDAEGATVPDGPEDDT